MRGVALSMRVANDHRFAIEQNPMTQRDRAGTAAPSYAGIASTVALVRLTDRADHEEALLVATRSAGLMFLTSVSWASFMRTGLPQPVTYLALAPVENREHLGLLHEVQKRSSATYVLAIGGPGGRVWTASVLDAGADDYLPSPVDDSEIAARLRANERRRAAGIASMTLMDLVLSPLARTLERRGRRVHLTPIEAHLLALFITNAGRTISVVEMASAVWGQTACTSGDRYKQVIARLRRKLGELGSQVAIRTIWGEGYRADYESSNGHENSTIVTAQVTQSPNVASDPVA